jgi:hypothetical protein
VLLHLYQPAEPGLEELERARPNGEVTYYGANAKWLKVCVCVFFGFMIVKI